MWFKIAETLDSYWKFKNVQFVALCVKIWLQLLKAQKRYKEVECWWEQSYNTILIWSYLLTIFIWNLLVFVVIAMFCWLMTTISLTHTHSHVRILNSDWSTEWQTEIDILTVHCHVSMTESRCFLFALLAFCSQHKYFQ